MSQKRWAQIEIWVEYNPETEQVALDKMFDAVADAAISNEPPSGDAFVSGSRNQDAPDWAIDET